MAVLSFRHAAMLSPSGYHLLDRLLAIPYNAALEERIRARRMPGRSISFDNRVPSLTAIRKRDPGWQWISAQVARPAPARLDRAILGFISRVKSGREPGFPRFRAGSRYRSFSVDVPKAAGSALRIRDGGRRWGELRRRGLRRIRLAIRRPLPRPDRIWGFRVVREARRVEIQLPFEQVLPTVRTGAPERPLGPDAGIRSFAILSDGGGEEHQRKPVVRVAVRRKQRALSHKWRGSKSSGTKKAALARARQRVAENGRQPINRQTDLVVKCRGFRAVELLQIRNTIRRGENERGLKRAVAAEGRGEFFDTLNCGAAYPGIPFVEVPSPGTSEDRSRCGTRVPRALSERLHRSGVCGLEMDRDGNAATNVLSPGWRNFAEAMATGGTSERAPAASAAC